MTRKSLLILTLCFSVFANAEIVRLKEVDRGVWRGSQPESVQDYALLQKLKIKTIINLRWDTTVEASKKKADYLKINFINVPLVATQRPSDEAIDTIFKHLLNKKNHPVYLHCKLGKDRTGLIFALYRVKVQGWTPQRAYKEWIDMGFSYKALRNLDNYFKSKVGMPLAQAG